MQSLIIFASGTGSNAKAIINHFRNSSPVKVSLIVSNKPDAGVLDLAKQENIPTLIISKKSLEDVEVIGQLKGYNPSLIVLAGFLLKIPELLIDAFPGIIINIHPALLPAYGGKGMHGQHVHTAVIENGEPESGITIHYVNEHYDAGNIIVQARCKVVAGDNPVTLAQRVLKLEHFFLPRTIEFLLKEME